MISSHFDLNPWDLILTLMRSHLRTTTPIGQSPVSLPINISPALADVIYQEVLLAEQHNHITDRTSTNFRI